MNFTAYTSSLEPVSIGAFDTVINSLLHSSLHLAFYSYRTRYAMISSLFFIQPQFGVIFVQNFIECFYQVNLLYWNPPLTSNFLVDSVALPAQRSVVGPSVQTVRSFSRHEKLSSLSTSNYLESFNVSHWFSCDV